MVIQSKSGKLHSAESAAEMLGVSPWTIRAWLKQGKLSRVKIGRLVRIWESELMSLVVTQPKTREKAT